MNHPPSLWIRDGIVSCWFIAAGIDSVSSAVSYGREDLAHFGPLWSKVRAIADEPFADSDMLAVADRIFEPASMTELALRADYTVVAVDGRLFELLDRGRDRNGCW